MKIRRLLILALGILCFYVGLCHADQEISSRDVPKAVRTAFAKAYPTEKVNKWDKEIFEGKVAYEAEGTDGKINRNVMYSPDGNVLQVEETLLVADLPAQITGSVSKQYPKAAIASAEKRVHGGSVEYALKLKDAPVRMIVVDGEGKIISTK